MSFLLKQLSMMRRFSSSNRSARLEAAPEPAPFARSIMELYCDHEGEADTEGHSMLVQPRAAPKSWEMVGG